MKATPMTDNAEKPPVDLAVVEGALEAIEAHDDVMDVLDDLDLGDAGPTYEAAAEEVIEELDFADLEAVGTAIEREAAYAEQVSDATVDTAAAATAMINKPARKAAGTRTPKTPKTPGAPRAPRDMASIPAEYFVTDVNNTDASTFEAAKTAMIAKTPTQKKVAEKFEQLFACLSIGKKPSDYVCDIFPVLDAKGSMTSSDIVATFKARGLGQGTAQSQCGQILVLFGALGIATRSGNTLTMNGDSKIAARLRGVLV